MRLLSRGVRTDVPNDIEHGQCRQAHGGIHGGRFEILQRVDDDQVSGGPGVEVGGLSQQGGYLAGNDIDGGTGHEGGNGRERDEVHNPATANQPDERDDTARNDREGGGDQRTREVRVFGLHVEDDLTRQG